MKAAPIFNILLCPGVRVGSDRDAESEATQYVSTAQNQTRAVVHLTVPAMSCQKFIISLD